jgi:hypothetical protein
VVAGIGTAPAPEDQRRQQAAYIATVADTLAHGAVIGPEAGAVARLLDAVTTLAAWTPDDRH